MTTKTTEQLDNEQIAERILTDLKSKDLNDVLTLAQVVTRIINALDEKDEAKED